MKIKVKEIQMQGNACGMRCFEFRQDDGTKYGKLIGYITPIQLGIIL